MQLRKNLIGLLLAVITVTAPHLHLEPRHDCVHHSTIEVAGDNTSPPAGADHSKPCGLCRADGEAQQTRPAAAAFPWIQLGRLAMRAGDVSHRATAECRRLGARAPPQGLFARL